ncbi:MAG: carbamoyltransferase HypF, partial [Thermoguttaceae bacterium]
ERLGPIADALVTHDRPIVRPVDDSIVRVGSGGVQVLRRARGFAPRPIKLTLAAARRPTVLAVGGHLKNTVALALPSEASASVDVVLGSHIGDLDGLASVEVFCRAIDDLTAFFHVAPDVVACDLHPDYASTLYARQLASRWNVPLLPMQHHHAHAASCMAEHGLRGPVLAFCWDGTGYGPDGTIWGGETLRCEGATYRRAAHLRTFALPGGDHAARQPRRSALGLLFELFGDQAAPLAAEWFSAQEIHTLLTAIQRRLNAPRTSSMGRLFDAVAAICGLPAVISFEGQAAMALEFAADPSETDAYPMPFEKDASAEPAIVDWAPMVRAVLADRLAGLQVGRISAKFHNALAEMAARTATALGRGLPIVLSGGCFQNVVLLEKVRARLSDEGFLVYTQSQTPPGDGGLSLGQAWLALQSLQNISAR